MRLPPLWLAIAAIVLAVVFVGFFVGFLTAADESPRSRAPAQIGRAPGGALLVGRVKLSGDKIEVHSGNQTVREYDLESVEVLAAEEGTFEELQPGDIVVLALERDQFGGPAVRFLVRIPREQQARAHP